MSISFDFDPDQQLLLERAVEVVIADPEVRRGEQTTLVKDPADEQIVADARARDCYAKVADQSGALYLSEESLTDAASRKRLLAALSAPGAGETLVYVCDEIDGSSEFARAGPMRSPLTSAIMAVQRRRVLAAVVGDIWSRQIYGLQATNGESPSLYVRNADGTQAHALSVSESKRRLGLSDAMVAGYAPSRKSSRIDLLLPLFREAAYVHNNGGHPFALRVVAGVSTKSYSVSLELAAKECFEQIGPILASAGGATVTRLDGGLIELDLLLKQTSLTAANPALAKEVVRALHDAYASRNAPHCESIQR